MKCGIYLFWHLTKGIYQYCPSQYLHSLRRIISWVRSPLQEWKYSTIFPMQLEVLILVDPLPLILQGVSIQKTSLSALMLCYTYPKLDCNLKNLLSHLIKHRTRMQSLLLCIHPRHGHTGIVAVILPQIKKFVFHTQGGRSAFHILIFVFCVQIPKKVG